MPPKKRAGRPIKRFPEIPSATDTGKSGQDTQELHILANAAQSVDFNFDKAWPILDEAYERLAHLRSLKTDRAFSKDNRKKLVDAINSLHAILLAPSPILNTTPDLYKGEFKERLISLTGQYVEFSINAAPRKFDAEKENYLLMIEDKLIKPIRGQPSLWGHHSLQITRYVTEWLSALDTTRAYMSRVGVPSAPKDAPGAVVLFNKENPSVQQSLQPAGPSIPQRVQFSGPENLGHSPNFPRPNLSQLPLRPSDNSATQQQAVQTTPQGHTAPLKLRAQIPNVGDPITTVRPTPIRPSTRPSMQPNVSEQAWAVPKPPAPLVFQPSRPTPAVNRPPRPAEPDPRPEITRHPAYLPEMTAIYGEVPPLTKIESDSGEEEEMDDQFSTPPKRPLSTSLDDIFTPKRQRTENGVQFMESDREIKDRVDGLSERRGMRRTLSRQEMYYEIAKEQEKDTRFLRENHPNTSAGDIAPTPILNNDEEDVVMLPARAPIRRTKSRADEELEEELTPAIREMMTPVPREGSPDRELWQRRPPSTITEVLSPTIPRPMPSHIRQQHPPSQMQLMFLPPGSNALGAKSPEAAEQFRDLQRPFAHSPSVEAVEKPVEKQRRMLPMPKGANEMPALMAMHDRMNNSRPLQERDFYLLKRIDLIGRASEWTKPGRDGLIRLGRYFYLAKEEIDETSEYLHYLTGHEVVRPKTMIRLTCRPKNGEQPGENYHAWPDHANVFLNSKSLLTSMNTPLYIAPEELKTMNQIRVKVHPSTVQVHQATFQAYMQGYFAIYLEVFSIFSFDQLTTYLIAASPEVPDTIQELRNNFAIKQEGFAKNKISLLCGGQDHPMKIPVFGNNCIHAGRVDLACFLKGVSVAADFEYRCPFCSRICAEEKPITVDKLMMSIIESDQPKAGKQFFQITSDGQICDDSQSDGESESSDPEDSDGKFEDNHA